MSICYSINQLSTGYADHSVLRNINVEIPKGKLTTVIGPNGCGKSTLLKSLSQLISIQSGDILLDGTPLKDFRRSALAKLVTYLPQQPLAPRGISVFDLVARGRTPHQTFLQQWSNQDQLAVETALSQVDLSDQMHAYVDELSGGQRQRAWIAMTLAQQTDTVLLDEPTASLDPKHQIDVFKLLRNQCNQQSKTVVVVVHDLNMALQFSDYVVVLRDGQLVKSGDNVNTLTTNVIKAAFNLECEITHASNQEVRALIPLA